MSKETKIGIFAVIVIAAFIWGYKFIKGQNLLSQQQFFYVEYNDVEQMQQSTPIFNRGFQVGTVTDIFPKKDDPKKVVVEMEINKNFDVPKDALAEIRQTAMGDKSINIVFDKNCQGANCAQSGDYLQGASKSVLGSMMNPNELEVYMKEVTKGLKEVTAGLNDMVNDPDNVLGKSMADMQVTMANLKNITGLLNREMRQNGKVNDILGNVNTLTASIDPNSMKSIVDNTNGITAKFNALDVEGVTANTNKTLEEAQAAIAKLTKTMDQADGAIKEFNTLIAKVNSGEGSIGKLLKDDKLYNDLESAAESTNILMTDFQQRPQRYIPFKSSRRVKKIDRKNPLVMPEEEERGEVLEVDKLKN